jgi:hypothetical protein
MNIMLKVSFQVRRKHDDTKPTLIKDTTILVLVMLHSKSIIAKREIWWEYEFDRLFFWVSKKVWK